MTLALSACSGGGDRAEPSAEIGTVLADGTVSDGELEQVWRLTAECLRDTGADAVANNEAGAWGVIITGEFDESEYDRCAADAERVEAAYMAERVVTGDERLELAESLRGCLAGVGVEQVPFTAETTRENEIVEAAIRQLGYDFDAYTDPSLGAPPWVDDPRFGQALDCIARHELLFPDRFQTNDG